MSQPWFLTSFGGGKGYADELDGMLATHRRFNPEVPAITAIFPEGERTWQSWSNFKVKWMLSVREQWGHLGAMLWVDADARFRKSVTVPEGVDIGGKFYDPKKLRMSTGTFLVGPSIVAGDVLAEWDHIINDGDASNEHPVAGIVRRNASAVFHEFPDSFTSVCNLGNALSVWNGRLEHDSAIVHWNRSRHVWGGQENWPPNEATRRAAKPTKGKAKP